MQIDYLEKITHEAIGEALKARDGLDTSIYDWIDELQLRVKEAHKRAKEALEISNLIAKEKEAQLKLDIFHDTQHQDSYSIKDSVIPSMGAREMTDIEEGLWGKWEGKINKDT